MKTKLFLLIAGICLIWTAVALAECKTVMTTDFQGRICTEANRESCEGRWINEDGGVFQGTKNLDCHLHEECRYRLQKVGNLTTPTFQGRLEYFEDRDPAGKISSVQRIEGKWLITPTLNLAGYIEIQRKADGSLIVEDHRRQIQASQTGEAHQ